MTGIGEKLPAPSVNKTRVLLIDDEPEFLDLTKFFLSREGSIEVMVASSARDGLEKLQEEKIDAVVSDYSMPGIDGLELLKIVRARGMDIPFILLTGKGREDVAIEALNSGADFYVRKGTDPKTQFADIINAIKVGVDRKRAVDESSISSRFLSRVFTSIRDGICVLDKDRTIIMANAAVEEWYPHLRPIVGKKCWEVFHPSSEEEHDIECPGKRTIGTGEASRELLRRFDANGNQTGWIEMFAFPLVEGEPGEVAGVIEYARDITELQATRERLMDELDTHGALDEVSRALIRPPSTIKEISRLVLESAKKLTNSQHGYVSSVDPVTKSIMSWTITDMLGKECSVSGGSIEFRVGPDGRYPRLWGHSMNTGEPFIANNPEEHELYVGVPDGHIKLKNYISVPAVIGGEIVGQIALANSSRAYGEKDIGIIMRLAHVYAMAVIHERDVAALKEANERLRVLGQLTQHDALNHITVMEGWLALARDSDNNTKINEILPKIAASVEALRAQTEFAVEYERLGANEFRWISLPDVCREASSVVELEGINMKCEIEDVEILADPMFGKVFENLFSNSVKHGEHVTTITIRAEEVTDGLRVIYEDDGVGIDPESKEAVFEARIGRNTGLGLYLAKELLKTCKMTIRETGEHGKGAMFEIDVPPDRFRIQKSSE